jgi:hypothetical protein
MYNPTLSLTAALDVVSGGPRPDCFTPGERDPVHIVREVGWVPETVWTVAENSIPHRDSIPGPFSP